MAIGAFDDPDRFGPEAHHHFDHKIAWFDTHDALPAKAAAASTA